MCNQKEELLKKIEELKKQVEQLDNEYPKYMLACEHSKCEQYIVKLTGETTGEVVATAKKAPYNIGQKNTKWAKYNRWWKEVTNPDKLCDKDLIECWDTNHIYEKVIRFYDADNNCTFAYNGKRNGNIYDNYKKIMPWKYPKWAIEAQKTLED